MAIGDDVPGTYKWLVVLASLMLQTLLSAVMSAIGVFYVIFRQNLGGSSSLISLASSVNVGVVYAIGPFAGHMVNRYGCRVVSVAGSLVATSGLCLTAFATEPWHIIITFGIISGSGMGLIYNPAIVAVGLYFNKRRPFAMGIGVTGMGIGPIISPPILRMLEKHYGWRGAILIFSGLFLHTIIFSALLRPVQNVQSENKDQLERPEESIGRKPTQCSSSSRAILTDVPLCFYLLQTLIYSVGLCIIQVHVGAFILPLGYTTDQAAMLILSMGIGSASSRVIFGVLLQILSLDPIKAYITTTTFLGFLSIAYPFANQYVSFLGIACALGFFSASYGNLASLIAIQLAGMDNFALLFGYVSLAAAIGYVVAGPASGWLYDVSGYYPGLFFLAGGTFLVSVVLLIIMLVLHIRKQHPRPSETTLNCH